jgi:hypothetical protein
MEKIMDENSAANILDDSLPSPDLISASVIFILFLASMTFIIPMIPMPIVPVQSAVDLERENLMEDSGKAMLLASPKPIPQPSYEPKPKQTKNEFKIKGSRFKFPPFKGKKGEHVFHPIIDKVSEQHNIEPALVKAVIMAESSYNPRAVSPRGAVGLMQLMPSTANSLGVSNSYNPEQNVQGGTKYLKELIDEFGGDIKLALAAYNAGPAHVKKHNGVPPFKETVYFVHKVYHYYDFYRNQEVIQASQSLKRNTTVIVEDVDEA